MPDRANTAITGRIAALAALAEREVPHVVLEPGAFPLEAASLLHDARIGHPRVAVIEGPAPGQSLDVNAIRWGFPYGACPVVLIPHTPEQCAPLAAFAAECARAAQAPVVLLLEPEVSSAPSTMHPVQQLAIKPPAVNKLPLPPIELPDAEREAREIAGRAAALSDASIPHHFDADPGEARAEWLVVSYGFAAVAAEKAVAAARADNQRVHHLRLDMLWPFPESVVIRAARHGVKHLVVAERNLGQYAQQLRLVLPEIAVIPAGFATEPVRASAVLARLQRSPRCC